MNDSSEKTPKLISILNNVIKWVVGITTIILWIYFIPILIDVFNGKIILETLNVVAISIILLVLLYMTIKWIRAYFAKNK